MTADPRRAFRPELPPGVDQNDAGHGPAPRPSGLRARDQGDPLDVPARHQAEVGPPGQGVVESETVHQHQHLVRPSTTHLRRRRPGASGTAHHHPFPAVERARQITPSAGQLVARDSDLVRAAHGHGDRVEPDRLGRERDAHRPVEPW